MKFKSFSLVDAMYFFIDFKRLYYCFIVFYKYSNVIKWLSSLFYFHFVIIIKEEEFPTHCGKAEQQMSRPSVNKFGSTLVSLSGDLKIPGRTGLYFRPEDKGECSIGIDFDALTETRPRLLGNSVDL